MNDEHDAGAMPGPEQDAHIRALLAELGSGPDGDPIPSEVAARLEDTLAQLVAEREREGTAQTTEPGNVVPMRRRWAPRLAGAAAAVILVGAGGVAAANFGLLGTSGSDDSNSAGAGEAQSAQDAPTASAGDTTDQLAPGASAALPKVSATTFAADVEKLLMVRGSARLTKDQSTPPDASAGSAPEKSTGGLEERDLATEQPRVNARLLESCPGPEIADGAVPSPVQYDGDLAVLVVHPEQDGRQVVEAWDCAGDQRLARATLTP